jgi:hypothetical protein
MIIYELRKKGGTTLKMLTVGDRPLWRRGRKKIA